MKKSTGIILAITAGALFATTAMTAQAGHHHKSHTKGSMVKCEGGNACKGKSVCRSASNACQGKNSCKGKGVGMVKNQKMCKKMGGHVA